MMIKRNEQVVKFINMIFAFTLFFGWAIFAGLLLMLVFMKISKTRKFPRLDTEYEEDIDMIIDAA